MARDNLSMEQMTSVLDNVPAAVFVSAVKDRRLLYVNRMAAKMFPQTDRAGTCYAVAGFDRPCPFCRAEKMNGSEPTVREYAHPFNHRVYQLSGKLIDWAGEEAHIEYILDITDRKREEERLVKAEQDMTATFENISCGLCIYRFDGKTIQPIFHNHVFYDIMGYSADNIRRVEQRTNYLNVHPEDLDALKAKIETLLRDGGTMQDTYRLWNDRLEEYRWIHLEGTTSVQEDGETILYGVYSDISDQKRLENQLTDANSRMRETQMELNHLVNSVPGGIASYRLEDGRFVNTYFSDGVAALAGFTREEYAGMNRHDALAFVYEQDRPRVSVAVLAAMDSGEVLDISYRTRHKNGSLVWIHLNGRRMGPRSDSARFYAVFTNMMADVSTLTNETADGVYIIDKDTYDLLYINESKKLSLHEEICVGKTCYRAIHGLDEPCAFCALKTFGPDEQEHEMVVEKTGLIYTVRVKESVWNGIPAYIMYLRDVTKETHARREKERLELYFQSLVKNLPGGISVIRCQPDGVMTPEYVSEGFASMLRMTVEEVETSYEGNFFAGVHPDDVKSSQEKLLACIERGEEHCELTVRFKRSDGSYVWIRDHISLFMGPDGTQRLYCVFTDISQLMAEKEQMRRQYEELILQHYRTPGPDTLILGHCNITRNKIIEIWDSTDSGLLDAFSRDRQAFFTGISTLIVDADERRAFRDAYLNEPSLEAFGRKETEIIQKCFIRLPQEPKGRYVRFQVNMVEAPDTGDITGILSVTDVTDQVISERILRQLSVTSHDYVIDLDLKRDSFTLLTKNENASRLPKPQGSYSERVAYMAGSVVVPRDREAYADALSPHKMEQRLKEAGLYTFAYSIEDEKGDIRAKNITVSAIDLRLGRISLVCTDITGSVREQQNLLSMLAYTFELTGMIDVGKGSLVMYTRQMILENLPPYVNENYRAAQERFAEAYAEESREEARKQFSLGTMLERLEETPGGYEFVLPFKGDEAGGPRYKQINVLWGDRNHETICMVRADVTEILAAERQAKSRLEKALCSAEEANRAKSDFLSAMSHDIRTPMNAIMGMTALAPQHLDDRKWMEGCLQKISISSKHLLSLVNDVLDMSRIEQGKFTLNPVQLSIPELAEHLSVMMEAQAKEAGIAFAVRTERIAHKAFFGDSLRIDQTLINLLSNAVKFTPEGGRVDFLIEEIPTALPAERVRYRFTVRDTGVGMSETFLQKAFEPFTRDESAARIQGTGLGLSIVHGLVELMQGDISAESRLGEGSVFRVELEFEIATDDDAPAAEAAPRSSKANEKTMFSGRRFLVAEDNSLNAEILCEILSGHGAELVVKQDGAQAVQAFSETAPGTYDAVLMDIQMPNMNGYEASRAIRSLARPDAKAIPIIALTANAFAEDIQTAAAAGMTAHVAKPIDVAVLRATLCRVLPGGKR